MEVCRCCVADSCMDSKNSMAGFTRVERAERAPDDVFNQSLPVGNAIFRTIATVQLCV
jgi:hypothetical protein